MDKTKVREYKTGKWRLKKRENETNNMHFQICMLVSSYLYTLCKVCIKFQTKKKILNKSSYIVKKK